MDTYTFQYQLTRNLPPKVFKERIEEIMQIPEEHQYAFLEMISFGYSFDKALIDCGKLAELARDHGVSPSYILKGIKQMESAFKAGVELRKLIVSDLN